MSSDIWNLLNIISTKCFPQWIIFETRALNDTYTSPGIDYALFYRNMYLLLKCRKSKSASAGICGYWFLHKSPHKLGTASARLCLPKWVLKEWIIHWYARRQCLAERDEIIKMFFFDKAPSTSFSLSFSDRWLDYIWALWGLSIMLMKGWRMGEEIFVCEFYWVHEFLTNNKIFKFGERKWSRERIWRCAWMLWELILFFYNAFEWCVVHLNNITI